MFNSILIAPVNIALGAFVLKLESVGTELGKSVKNTESTLITYTSKNMFEPEFLQLNR